MSLAAVALYCYWGLRWQRERLLSRKELFCYLACRLLLLLKVWLLPYLHDFPVCNIGIAYFWWAIFNSLDAWCRLQWLVYESLLALVKATFTESWIQGGLTKSAGSLTKNWYPVNGGFQTLFFITYWLVLSWFLLTKIIGHSNHIF